MTTSSFTPADPVLVPDYSRLPLSFRTRMAEILPELADEDERAGLFARAAARRAAAAQLQAEAAEQERKDVTADEDESFVLIPGVDLPHESSELVAA